MYGIEGPELSRLEVLAAQMRAKLEAHPGFVDVRTSYESGRPEVTLEIDRGRAADAGVSAAALGRTLRTLLAGEKVSSFEDRGNRYDVRVRLEEAFRGDPDAIGALYLRTKDGGVVELRNIARVETGAAPSTISRDQRQRSVTISADLEGIAVGDAIERVRAIAAELLPDGVSVRFGGSAEAFLESVEQFGLALVLSILVIYMLLAAQFESLLHPLTVMLALPLSMVGALGALFLLSAAGRPGMTLNLFSLIGIILLFGLVTKNSILLVDFANQLRREGRDKLEAMRTAAPVRMRPVLMTAFSMIFGVLPAAIGVGPGAESRQPMAIVTGAGMLSSTLLTLLVVPVFYLVLDDAMDWVRARLRRRAGAVAVPR